VRQEAGGERRMLAAVLRAKKSEELFDTDRDFTVKQRRFYGYGLVRL
jgi:hypothetical protein